MYIVALCLAILLFSLSVCTADTYQIRSLSESAVVHIYEDMMLDACRQANSEWHELPGSTNEGYWGDGVSEGNQGIRATTDMIFVSAALLKYSDSLNAVERKELLNRAVSGIRYAVSTHLTSSQDCTDGKKWGNSWQSGMWIGPLAFGAWLIWDDLSPELHKDVERVVSSEADRFLSKKPPSGRWADTKAEENGWDLTCISVATNMFPSHPHAAAWNEKAIEYMMNVLSVAQDKKDETMVDGRPVRDWVCTENLHPDFTLENHNILHPSYIQCSSYFLTEAAMHYAYAGKPVPQAAAHHLMDVWNTFRTILLPSGETTYPQGQDWELHGLNPINLFASLGTYMQDPLAAALEKTNIQYMREWQRWSDGSLAVPGSRLGFTRHAIQAEQATWGYLAHKIFGPSSDQPVPPTSDIVKHYNLVDVVLHSTRSKHFTFSWKNRIMGVLTPIAEGHENNPFFTVPIWNGFIGTTELDASTDKKMTLVERTWKKTAVGFETTGVLQTNGGLLGQAIRVTSVGEKAVVYQDRITALSDVSVKREMGVPIGIENDQVSGGKRIVYYDGGKVAFDWKQPQQPFAVPGSWANVDGRLGIVAAAGSGIAYCQAGGYNPQGVYADILYGSYSNTQKNAKANDDVAHRIILYFVEITPEQTSAIASSLKIEGKVLRFALPEGGEAEVALI